MVDSKVNIPVNIKGSQIQKIKKQDEDDHWISEEELYTEGSSDEEKSSNSSRKHLKGLSHEELLKQENDLIEMKKSIEKLEEKLSNNKTLKEIYDFGNLREFDVTEAGEKITACIDEIKNLDEILKLKTNEIKIAKQERISGELESTQLLMELSKSETSEAIKNNSDQFLKLLQREVNDQSGENETNKRDDTKSYEAPRKPGTFIVRNKKLAKCGDGVLSLTDEEKTRLKIVLSDIDEKKPSDQVVPFTNEYAFSEETKKTLEEIDRKLEEHEKTKCQNKGSVLNCNEIGCGGKEKTTSKITTDTKMRSLKEVDKLLNALNSTNEVIDPLLDEDLQELIEESRRLLHPPNGAATSDNPVEIPTKEKMTELVKAAKSTMPNFRFRLEH